MAFNTNIVFFKEESNVVTANKLIQRRAFEHHSKHGDSNQIQKIHKLKDSIQNILMVYY